MRLYAGLALLFSLVVEANDYYNTPEYKFEKECIGTLSYARDRTESTQKETFLDLTDHQNQFLLKHPAGHFKNLHIQASKILVKNRTEERGIDYLRSELTKCGWEGQIY